MWRLKYKITMNEIGLIGKKIGMSREFYKTGQSVPVTVLKVEKARVIDVIDESKRGYKAIQVGFGTIKTSKITKAMKNLFSKKNTEPRKKRDFMKFYDLFYCKNQKHRFYKKQKTPRKKVAGRVCLGVETKKH